MHPHVCRINSPPSAYIFTHSWSHTHFGTHTLALSYWSWVMMWRVLTRGVPHIHFHQDRHAAVPKQYTLQGWISWCLPTPPSITFLGTYSYHGYAAKKHVHKSIYNQFPWVWPLLSHIHMLGVTPYSRIHIGWVPASTLIYVGSALLSHTPILGCSYTYTHTWSIHP